MKNINLIKYFEESIRENWDKPALRNWRSGELTYCEVAAQIKKLHFYFEEIGLRPGDRIALCGGNSMNWAIVYLATITKGMVIVPILHDFQADQIHHVINHSESSVFFCDKTVWDKLEPTGFSEIDSLISLEDFSVRKESGQSAMNKMDEARSRLAAYQRAMDVEKFRLSHLPGETVAAVVYTSGTTGLSKGVVLTHNSLLANVHYAREYVQLKAGDNVLSFLPLAHCFGCAFDFLFPFSIGSKIIFLGKIPSPRILLDAFAQVRPGFILMVPLLLEKIYQTRILPKLTRFPLNLLYRTPIVNKIIRKKIRKQLIDLFGGKFSQVAIGGAALNADVEKFLKDINFPLTVGYGMTECGPIISYCDWTELRPRSAGKIIDTLEVRIDSEDPFKIPGEIQVKGINVMKGYFRNVEATKEVLSEDGWLGTGDIGVIDKDNFVYIRGRCKSMLLGPSGQNIYPEEIEAELDNFPLVAESLAVQRDDKVMVLVYPNLEAVDSLKLDDAALKKELEKIRKAYNKKMPAYIALKKIEVHPEPFTRTPTKKIKRHLYR